MRQSIADPKLRMHRAFDAARRADPRSAITYKRQLADILLAVEGQSSEVAAECYRRAVAFEIAADRTQWPQSIVAFMKKLARERRRNAAAAT